MGAPFRRLGKSGIADVGGVWVPLPATSPVRLLSSSEKLIQEAFRDVELRMGEIGGRERGAYSAYIERTHTGCRGADRKGEGA